MQFEENAKLLTAESKPYDFNGNSGVSHKIRLSIGGEIFVCNSNESQVSSLKQYEKNDGVVVLEVVSKKEKMSLNLISFVPTK